MARGITTAVTRSAGVVATALALSACANAIDPPSYLGAAPQSIEYRGAPAAGQPTSTKAPAAVRYVSSNRVLGAMAFQKVTGADVDPRTLSGSREP